MFGSEAVSGSDALQGLDSGRNWYMLALISLSEVGASSSAFDAFYDAYISDILRCTGLLKNVVRFSLPAPLTTHQQVSGQVNFLTIYQLKKNSEPQGLESAILSPEHATAFAEFRRWKSETFAYFDRGYYLCETPDPAVVDALTKSELYLQSRTQFGVGGESGNDLGAVSGVAAGAAPAAGAVARTSAAARPDGGVEADAHAAKNGVREEAVFDSGESIAIQFERVLDASPSGLSRCQEPFIYQLGGAERAGDKLTFRSWLQR
ncbi:MAG: hypothetical protein K2Y32_09095 [Candidatus Obscuribacterales bacterium]|nr:hypothetical protein [Candidatus Obscuribacterales bacterium]